LFVSVEVITPSMLWAGLLFEEVVQVSSGVCYVCEQWVLPSCDYIATLQWDGKALHRSQWDKKTMKCVSFGVQTIICITVDGRQL